MKTVSIIIPTRNRYKEVERLLTSIKQSTYKEIEIILADDNSINSEVISSIAKRFSVSLIKNKENRGLAYTRSIGAHKAKGDYILFIDDDNVLEEHMVTQLVNSLDKHKSLAAVGPKTYYLSDKSKLWFLGVRMNLATSRPSFYSTVESGTMIGSDLFITENLHNCFMIRRELGEEVGWFDHEIFMSGTEFDLLMKVKIKHPMSFFASNINAICYHDVPYLHKDNLRSFGLDSEKRIYYVARNKGVLTGRYGKLYEKILFGLVFYPIIILFYSFLIIRKQKINFLWYYVRGFIKGYYYLITKGNI